MKDKEYHAANFATSVSKLLFFPLQKWMNLISNRLSTASIKYLNWPSLVFGRFQNGCNKVVTETSCRAILVWNHTCDFKSNSRCTLVQFWNQAYDFSPNCTPLSSISIIYQIKVSCELTNSGFLHLKKIRKEQLSPLHYGKFSLTDFLAL